MKAMPPISTLFGHIAQRIRPGIALVVAGLILLGLLPHDASAQTTFNYTGGVQTYTVPADAGGVAIVANGAGGGSGGNDSNGWGGAGGAGARITGTYLAPAGTVLNIYVGQGGESGKTSDGNPYTRATADGAGGGAAGGTGYAGGAGGMPGGSGWSGGGAGGGAASVVATAGNVHLAVAGGGGGGQGGALDVLGRAGVNATTTGTYLTANAGTAGDSRANNVDGAGGGGGGGGCPRGAGGAAIADSSGNNNTRQATGGGSCASAAVTGFGMTGGAGGAGGVSVTGSAPASGNPGNNGSVTITPIFPRLNLVKSAPSPALKVGTNSAYTLTTTNGGLIAVSAARVVDQLPANMVYVSGTGTGWTCTAAASGGGTLVTCNYSGTISAGATAPLLTITARPTNIAPVTNYASIDPIGRTTPPTPTTCTSANTPSAGCAAPVTSTPTSVILGLVKSTPSPALQTGVNSAYTLTVTNTGAAAATTARVQDQLPPNLTYVSGTGTGWSCGTTGNTLVTCNFAGNLPADGGTSALTITVAPTNTTTSITNYASVDPTGGTSPPVPTSCTAANAPAVGCAAPVTSSVVLGLVKSVPTPALKVGSNSAYTLTVTNSGTAVATTARVVDQLPANMSYVSGTGTGWTCTTAASGGGTLVTCTYTGVLAGGGGVAAVVITATPTSTASVTNYASVDPAGGVAPPTPASCTAANTPTAGCAAPVTSVPTSVILGLIKSAPSPALQVFSNSAYTLTVTNTGTVNAATARVLDQLPANLTYVSGVGTGWSCATAVNAGGTLVTCNYSGSIAGGGSAALVITVTVTSGAPVTNYAAVDPSGGTTPPVPTTCTAANLPSAGCAAPVSTTAGRLVAGNVYSDTNHNGNLDAGEAGLGGTLFVKLAPISGGVCTGPAMMFASVGPGSSAYSLPSVAQGSYCLIVDDNSTLGDITPTIPGSWIGTQNPTGVIQLVVGAAPPAPQNFGLYNGSKLSGNVFADNGAGGGGANNGIKAGSEAGLAGVTVSAMQGVAVVASASSGSDGSYLLWVPAAISGTVVITAALPSGYIATGGSAGTSGGSYTRPSVTYTAAAGQSPTGVNFGMVPPNTLAPNGAQTAEPGTVVFYAHTYSVGTGGSVTFSLAQAATPASPAWSQVLYQDSNCDATLGVSEPAVSAAITVTAGQTLCLIVKQFVPAGASQGAQNSVTLSSAFSYANAPTLAVSSLVAMDVTTVGQAGDLTLAKLVRNLSPVMVDGVPGPPGPFATSVNANPGNTLEYSLTATNTGAHALSTLFVSDTTTAFTTFVAAACPLPAQLPTGITACVVTTQPAVGAQGALKWTFTGSLAPSALLKVTYQVKIDQ